jgi:predicted esterase
MDNGKYLIKEPKKDSYIVIPKTEEYKRCIFFFCGWKEKPKKYAQHFKNFLEKENLPNIKIIMPSAPIYNSKDMVPVDFKFKDTKMATRTLSAWFQFHLDHKLRTQGMTYNKEKDLEISSLILQESEILGGTEKIILAGFSMGGRYVLHLCDLLYLKFNSIILYKCLYTVYQKNQEEEKLRIQNIYYLFSIHDEVITCDSSLRTIAVLKQIKPATLRIKIDNIRNHTIMEGGAMQMLKEVLLEKEVDIFDKDRIKITGKEKF